MKIHSIKFNFLMNTMTTVLNFLFPLITFPYVSRVLAPEGYGAAEFALSVAQIFALVALLGVNTYGIRECAKVRDDATKLARTFQELLLVIGTWTILVTASYYVSVFLIPRFYESASLFLVAGLLIPLSSMGLQWFMSANEQYAFMALRNLIVKIVVVVAMFVFVRSENDVVIWVAISVASTGLMSIINVVYIFRQIGLQKWRSLAWRRHIKPLVIFFLMVASTSIYTTLDSVMLGFMTSDVDVGYYNVAIKIKNVFVSIVGALAAVLIPRATYCLAQNDERGYFRIVNMSVRGAVIYSFFIVAVGTLFAEPIMLLLAGEQYAASVLVLQVVMPAVLFVSFTQITLSEILTPKNRERELAITYAAAGILDIILNLILIPPLHAIGAAIATAIAEFLVLIVHLLVIARSESLMPYVAGCGRIVPWEVASVVMLMAGRLLGGPTLSAAVFSIIAALGTLLVGLWATKEPLVTDLLSTIRQFVGRFSRL